MNQTQSAGRDLGATLILRSLLGLAALVALTACSEAGLSPTTDVSGGRENFDSARHPDADVAALIALSEKAARRAEEEAPSAVLRQLGISPDVGRTIFLFTDAAATKAVTVIVPEPGAPPEAWSIHIGVSQLIGHPSPGIDLPSLRIGPASVARAATGHWPACGIRSIGLHGQGDDLVWYVDCNLPEGVVSGTVDGQSGVFTPSLAPPAIVPPVATPDCRRYTSAQGC